MAKNPYDFVTFGEEALDRMNRMRFAFFELDQLIDKLMLPGPRKDKTRETLEESYSRMVKGIIMEETPEQPV